MCDVNKLFWAQLLPVISWCELKRWGYGKKLKLLFFVVWGLPAVMVSSWKNKPHSLERENKILLRRSAAAYTWRGNWKRPHTQPSHPMDCTCTCTRTSVGAHTGWTSECSAFLVSAWLKGGIESKELFSKKIQLLWSILTPRGSKPVITFPIDREIER